jgi:hypothetical protein
MPLPISAVDSISPAFEHTKQQLLKPFRWGQWSRLALVGMLAGEMSSGGCNFNYGGGGHTPRDSGRQFLPASFPHIDPAKLAPYIGLIIVGALAFVVLFFVFLYINSVFRFILFDSVVQKNCAIRAGWRKWRSAGRRFFLWQIVFQIATVMVFVILIGIPVGIALLLGWIQQARAHMIPLVLGGIFLFFVFMAFVLLVLIVHVMAKDFLVPIMGLQGLDFADGWSRVLAMAKVEKGSYAFYMVLKAVLSIAAFIVFGILAVIIVLIGAIPGVVLAVAIGLTGKSAGLAWNAYTITLAVLAGMVALIVLLYVISLVLVPVIVFFPAYSIYFFASRYPALDALIHPAPPSVPMPPSGGPPPEPLPLSPAPEPIG